MEKFYKTVVIIPAFQEETHIFSVIQGCQKEKCDVIVVDDGSSDNTAQEAKAAGAIVLKHAFNQGKGKSIVSGIKLANAKKYDEFIFMDGDGQHKPEEIPLLLKSLRQNSADLVIGNRMNNTDSMPLVRVYTNKLMSFILSCMAHTKIPDSQCGFKALSAYALYRLDLETSKYEVDSEILLKAASLGLSIDSVEISTVYDNQRSSISPIADTFRFIRFIIKNFFTSKRKDADGNRC